VDSNNKMNSLQQVFEYHQSTKHDSQRFAKGPGYLDWETQPNPFRRYKGAPLIPLEKNFPSRDLLYDEVFIPGRVPPAPVNFQSISQLFFDSLAISAWKKAGETSWALRVNPSSGNLHPTEGYLICGPIEGLCDTPMICHYAPKEHGLEVRAKFELPLWEDLWASLPGGTFFIGLASIHWREAWKYGQRAYRYCQHDVGHAIGAISIASAGLGWRARILDDMSAEELTLLMGMFRNYKIESEEPDLLMAIIPCKEKIKEMVLPGNRDRFLTFENLDWRGSPNQLSQSQIDWGLDEISGAARKPHGPVSYARAQKKPNHFPLKIRSVSLSNMIHQRRSAVAMDGKTRISQETFYRILQRAVAVADNIPFSALPWKPYIHLAIFVHRVDNLASGLYFLARDSSMKKHLEKAFTQVDAWRRPLGCPDFLKLYCLFEGDLEKIAQNVSCSQEIAGDSCFSLGMIAEYEKPLESYGPWFYPRLFWEAGVIGQMLYLEAEAAGIRGTGIGCFFDDAMHEILGLKDRKYQDLYHFTVGGPVEDTRLTTLPAYSKLNGS